MDIYELLPYLVIIPNTIVLLTLSFLWFKERYVVADIETWNKVVTYYNEHIEAEEDNCGGGVGYFREYIDNEYIDDNDDSDKDVYDGKRI